MVPVRLILGMLRFENLKLDYEPYPIGVARPVLNEQDYAEMVASFPTFEQLKGRDHIGKQYVLSETVRGPLYRKIVSATPVWQRFHDYIKSEAFLVELLGSLRAGGVDLELSPRAVSTWKRVKLATRTLFSRRPPKHVPTLSSRFIFAAMPTDGGNIRPHTDHAAKAITLVLPIVGPEGWDESLGGGTSVVWPKDKTRIYNQRNVNYDFEDFETLRTYPFGANQALVFIKTFNSWHAVWPMTGHDPKALRKTVVINVEAY